MNDKDSKLIQYLEELIERYHGLVYGGSSTLLEYSEIIERSDVPAKIKLKNTKFCVLDEDNSLPQTHHIKNAVSYEVLEFVFEWENLKSLEKMSEPKNIHFLDEKLVLEAWDWDDPKLPEEVINSYWNIDEIGTGEDLEEWYEGLENINYDDFPKSLVPLIKNAVKEYLEFKDN